MTTARPASRSITNRRRSSRSMMTPPKIISTIAGTAARTARVPNATSDRVVLRMYHAMAAEFIPLPNMDTTLAASTYRSARFWRMSRIFSIYMNCWRFGAIGFSSRRHLSYTAMRHREAVLRFSLRRLFKKEKQEHRILRQMEQTGDVLRPEYHRATPECPHPERWSMYDSMTAEA